MKKTVVVWMLLIAAVITSGAQEKAAEAPKPAGIVPTFGATMFGNYAYVINGTDGRDFNKFDLDRVYFTMKSQIADDWKLQITTDIYRNTATGSYYNGLDVRLKFAYLDYAVMENVSVKFGMIPGVWNGVEESLWKYRGVYKTVSDQNSYYQTSDLGISATYTLPSKLGEVAAYMQNGDGYQSPELNRYKDYVFRATLNPFTSIEGLKGLSLSGIGSIGSAGTTRALERNRYGVLAGYSNSVVLVGAEYIVRKDAPSNPDTVRTGNAFSLFTEIKAPFAGLQSKLSLILRYDGIEPNVDKGGDMSHFVVAGIAWKATDRITFVLDNQLLVTETNSLKRSTDNVALDTDRRWFVHTILTF